MILQLVLGFAAALSYSDFMIALSVEGCPQQLERCRLELDPVCDRAATERSLCLMLNNCTSDAALSASEYHEDCVHCWTRLLTDSDTFKGFQECARRAWNS